MTYQEATEYLFTAAPLFQNIGAGAYKEGLSNTHALDKHFLHPHHSFKTIHVGGTNGKGSVSHTLAAILQSAGYKVGLYTSPHLVDFRERIRINGEMIPEKRVIDFIEKEKAFFEPLHPSFFEITTAMAFKYFAECQIDIAVIEVGLGGRLDCTNIITPILSIITNISFDHTQFLGNTLEKIAEEKAGIIKQGVPAVIGESENPAVRNVFVNRAEEVGTKIYLADETNELIEHELNTSGGYSYRTRHFGDFDGELGGLCQNKNTSTILQSVRILREQGMNISTESVHHGFKNVGKQTGLMGRWQIISREPLVICDTGHNVGGIKYIVRQLQTTPHKQLRIVMGMVNDKDINTVLSLMPKNAIYYFTQASVKRALPADEFALIADKHNLKGSTYNSVRIAMQSAVEDSHPEDLIFVGGSTFVVADALKNR